MFLPSPSIDRLEAHVSLSHRWPIASTADVLVRYPGAGAWKRRKVDRKGWTLSHPKASRAPSFPSLTFRVGRKQEREDAEEVYREMQSDLWTYPADSSAETLDRFEVEATDGDIGKVDEATYEVGSSYIVVDTGPWILGRKVLLPAGVIERIDLDNRKVQVRLTKDQIKNSPEFDPDSEDFRSEPYRERIGSYYATYYR